MKTLGIVVGLALLGGGTAAGAVAGGVAGVGVTVMSVAGAIGGLLLVWRAARPTPDCTKDVVTLQRQQKVTADGLIRVFNRLERIHGDVQYIHGRLDAWGAPRPPVSSEARKPSSDS